MDQRERERILALAKAKGLDLSSPKLTVEQIIAAGNGPPAARMLVTETTTAKEIRDFMQGKARKEG